MKCLLFAYQFSYGTMVSQSSAGLSKVAHLVNISRLLYFAFLYGWCFLNTISLDWPLTLTTQPSTSKLSNNFFFFKEFNQCLNNGKVSATKRGNEILYNKLLQK